jgi:hypothetical protein
MHYTIYCKSRRSPSQSNTEKTQSETFDFESPQTLRTFNPYSALSFPVYQCLHVLPSAILPIVPAYGKHSRVSTRYAERVIRPERIAGLFPRKKRALPSVFRENKRFSTFVDTNHVTSGRRGENVQVRSPLTG